MMRGEGMIPRHYVKHLPPQALTIDSLFVPEYLLLDGANVNGSLSQAHSLYVRYRGVLLSFEERIDFLQRLTLSLNPVNGLKVVRKHELRRLENEDVSLTMSTTMMMSQEALMMYIFHPIFSMPIGMTNTSTMLQPLVYLQESQIFRRSLRESV